jgi:hypothetical protein
MVGWLVGILPRVITAGMRIIAIAATVDDVDAGAGPGNWGGCGITAAEVHGQDKGEVPLEPIDPTQKVGERQQQAAGRCGETQVDCTRVPLGHSGSSHHRGSLTVAALMSKRVLQGRGLVRHGALQYAAQLLEHQRHCRYLIVDVVIIIAVFVAIPVPIQQSTGSPPTPLPQPVHPGPLRPCNGQPSLPRGAVIGPNSSFRLMLAQSIPMPVHINRRRLACARAVSVALCSTRDWGGDEWIKTTAARRCRRCPEEEEEEKAHQSSRARPTRKVTHPSRPNGCGRCHRRRQRRCWCRRWLRGRRGSHWIFVVCPLLVVILLLIITGRGSAMTMTESMRQETMVGRGGRHQCQHHNQMVKWAGSRKRGERGRPT